MTSWHPTDACACGRTICDNFWGGVGLLTSAQATCPSVLPSIGQDKKFTEEQILHAEKIAREIETTSTKNSHLAEERGQKGLQEDEDMDEEDKYSKVRARAGARAGGLASRSVCKRASRCACGRMG